MTTPAGLTLIALAALFFFCSGLLMPIAELVAGIRAGRERDRSRR